jgi:hypothetical protein
MMDTSQAPASTAWSKVLARKMKLKGQKLVSWSRSGRAKAVPFAVDDISTSAVEVNGPTFKRRRISSSDFEYIAERWEPYLKGQLRRDELNRSQNTTYILTILHWLDSN